MYTQKTSPAFSEAAQGCVCLAPKLDCVRDLLKFLYGDISVTPSGKRPRPVHLSRVVFIFPLRRYAPEAVYEAARYLYQKELISLKIDLPLPKNHVQARFTIPFTPPQPRAYVITGITALGLELLHAFADDAADLSELVPELIDCPDLAAT